MATDRGWYSRGYLPHIDVSGVPQFLTWRLADSIPAEVLERWREELEGEEETEMRKELAKRVEIYCDAGHGSCLLSKPAAARVVQEKLFEGDGALFELHAWSIMPNHVHALLTPSKGVELAEVVQFLKGGSSRNVNRSLGRRGTLWEPDYFDRFIRNGDHFARVVNYIEWNPVKAKLCSDPKRFSWSSASADARKRLEFLRSSRGRTEVRAPDAG